MTTDEAYRVLGLGSGVGAEEVKRAYRRKALESHPDRYTDPRDKAFHEKRFLEAREAYAHLRASGFPDLPAESEVAPDYGPKLAGRSFAPRDLEDVPAAEKLGLQVPWKIETLVTWGLGLPAAIAALAYFVKLLIGLIRG